MHGSATALLADPAVVDGLRRAWLDSRPGLTGGHEEGGFILRDDSGTISISRWPVGATDAIDVPPHAACRFDGRAIVATFHTHPNTGDDYRQEPSELDRRAVRDDPDLKEASYLGEFVVSQELIYVIDPNGDVADVGSTTALFSRA
jgi:hypothetical protein